MLNSIIEAIVLAGNFSIFGPFDTSFDSTYWDLLVARFNFIRMRLDERLLMESGVYGNKRLLILETLLYFLRICT